MNDLYYFKTIRKDYLKKILNQKTNLLFRNFILGTKNLPNALINSILTIKVNLNE